MKLILLLFVCSCSSILTSGSPREIKRTYSYTDISGHYVLLREHKRQKNKLVSRNHLNSNVGGIQKSLEKSVTVSELGSAKFESGRTLVMRPFASEFIVWLEGKRYESKMRLDEKSKSMIVELDSPEEKWKGQSSISFPKGKQFCFYSQIPECLYHNQILTKAMNKKNESIKFFIVWDNYPYIQEQMNGVGGQLFSPAEVKFEGEDNLTFKYDVEVDGQTLIYHFSKSFDLIRMFWIAQGISIVPPGEENKETEE